MLRFQVEVNSFQNTREDFRLQKSASLLIPLENLPLLLKRCFCELLCSSGLVL